ncbi:MAG TPA: phosphatidylserine decarboxylase [Bryobacteraceae bacterium]|jgi:phosphatidylserine decarboxylase|nr:phosphatidylserine decarboxylase [Bryobacteraceae bacterium]
MVKDGIYYGVAFSAAGALIGFLLHPAFAAPLLLAALFCLYFFRDPDRTIPDGPVAVSPADGKVVAIIGDGVESTRISIFLNIFDVHVNRAPIAGKIAHVEYTRGRFLVASREVASSQNERNTVTIAGSSSSIRFAQIAGLIARRIVFYKQLGDTVAKGERVGLIKFGSRVDIFLGPEWEIKVQSGERVSGGSSILAQRREVTGKS